MDATFQSSTIAFFYKALHGALDYVFCHVLLMRYIELGNSSKLEIDTESYSIIGISTLLFVTGL